MALRLSSPYFRLGTDLSFTFRESRVIGFVSADSAKINLLKLPQSLQYLLRMFGLACVFCKREYLWFGFAANLNMLCQLLQLERPVSLFNYIIFFC